ncbi:tetratricopeptide repeat protein [Microbacterium bovistercoris]|uniref:Tetratricopeptide repeat protein n=1 Tax=Microbacterium bovistercoris TaxID=2293570 RepID=A0A371NV55_9MICO|nr:tetratricopeptide repeat protein [Microbacterium bovistercoris]REJ06398.1 tetratricopeptide repeat protein [Microbacterium bovistercoris]
MTDPASALLAANRRRRRIRRWIAIGSIPLVIAGLVLVAKLLSMYAFAHQSISAYVTGDYAGSEAAAHGQSWWNVFEPYKAPFNSGTALAGADRLPEARADLEDALTLAKGLEVCDVRINLAIVVERMGDAEQAGGDAAKAAELYGEALEITVDTPKECDSEQAQQQSSDPSRDMGDTLDDLEDRLQKKQQQGQQQPEQGQGGDGQTEQQPDQGKLDDIEDKLGQGQQDREDQLGGGGSGDDEGAGSGTDKPW